MAKRIVLTGEFAGGGLFIGKLAGLTHVGT